MKKFISVLKCNNEKITSVVCETKDDAILYFAKTKQLSVEDWSKIYTVLES